MSPRLDVKEFLADPTTIREWNIQGLPSDGFSTENGIIVTRGTRWPLVIDPQCQAVKWIKNMEAKNVRTILLYSFLSTPRKVRLPTDRKMNGRTERKILSPFRSFHFLILLMSSSRKVSRFAAYSKDREATYVGRDFSLWLYQMLLQALRVIDFGQADFMRVLEQALQFGWPVLLENVGETLDPALNPILERAFIKSGKRQSLPRTPIRLSHFTHYCYLSPTNSLSFYLSNKSQFDIFYRVTLGTLAINSSRAILHAALFQFLSGTHGIQNHSAVSKYQP